MKISTSRSLLVALSLLFSAHAAAHRLVYFPMELTKNKTVVEQLSAQSYTILGASPLCNIDGINGKVLRLDGCTNYIEANLNAGQIPSTLPSLSVSFWCAPETYPMLALDRETADRALVVGNINHDAHTGFGFFLGRDGKSSFEYYNGAEIVKIQVRDKMPCSRWTHVVGTIDGTSGKARIYFNGQLMGEAACNAQQQMGNSPFMIGRTVPDIPNGVFSLNTFNGAVDEVEVFSHILSAEEINTQNDAVANLAFAAERYDDDLQRPRFHGMPSGNWTNESHGMVYWNGKYHVFFQKNGNGPYMSRLQWGHIVSDNLATWQEMPIAIYTDQTYDIKGCWSGHVFADPELTGGKPNIFYTAVDYAKARMAQAAPVADDLMDWTKQGVLVDGRPDGLSDDFRDPHLFRTVGGDVFMIVGTSKDNRGACTLHKYNKTTKTWHDAGIFYQAADAAYGTFWEMPTIEKLADRWLFTATPIGGQQGVETMYWTGQIAADGTFVADSDKPGKVDLDGMSKDGYGMLSPSVMQTEGKTIALGIVPDKLGEHFTSRLGYAHCYSLPREWSLDGTTLIQKPYSGLSVLRSATSHTLQAQDVKGDMALGDVRGRMVELIGEWTVTSTAQKMGFKVLDNGTSAVQIYYAPRTRSLVVDMSGISREVNDAAFGGKYTTTLPQTIAVNGTLKIHAFLDGSILDIFVNDKWACSIRVFCTDEDALGVKTFAEGTAKLKGVEAYVLDPKAAETSHIGTATSDNRAPIIVEGGRLLVDSASSIDLFLADGTVVARHKNVRSAALPMRRGLVIARVTNASGTSSYKLNLGE